MDIRNTKKLIIAGSIIFVIVLFIFVWSIFSSKDKGSKIIPVTSPTISIPTKIEEKITISNVILDNFYKEGRVINNNQDVVISEKSDYRILYLPLFKQFIINILTPSFESARKEAENEFIKSLSISKMDACKLKVVVGTTYSVNPDFAKKSYRLSFCEK